MRIAILGGTGNEGQGLALRWSRAGHEVLIGSRDARRAEQVASQLRARRPDARLRGLANLEAARQAEVAVLTVPYAGHAALLAELAPVLQGKVLVDVTVPLDPQQPRRYLPPPGGSAAQEAAALLGSGVRVVGAFHNVSHAHLQDLEAEIEVDVLVSGDDPQAKELAIALAGEAGMRAVDAGPLENAAVSEGLTAVLLHLNLSRQARQAGIRITGLRR